MPRFTNIKESGLEVLIVKWLVEHNGYEEGNNADYNKTVYYDFNPRQNLRMVAEDPASYGKRCQ